jgi:hypothetical protein
MAETRWNGEPCEARKVVVVVADASEVPQYWARDLVGAERNAVEVVYAGDTFYLDDEPHGEGEAREIELRPGVTTTLVSEVGHDGWGWEKVVAGGSPRMGHRNLHVERVVRERA